MTRLGRRAAVLGALAAACGRTFRVPVVAPGATPSLGWMKRAADPLFDVTIACDLRALLADASFADATRRGLRAAADRAVEGAAVERALDSARGALVFVGREGDLGLVLLGVAAGLDPESLHGWDAATQWKPVRDAPAGSVEYRYAPVAGSLFVLSDGTWALGTGLAAQRLRAALSTAGGAPVSELRLTRPIELHVPGTRALDVRRRVHVRALGAMFDDLRELYVGATVGTGATVVAELLYAGREPAARAAALLTDVLRALDRHPEASLAWLGGASAGRDAERLRVTVPLAPAVMRAIGELDSGLL